MSLSAPQRAQRIRWSAFDRPTTNILLRKPGEVSIGRRSRREPGQGGDYPDERREDQGADDAAAEGKQPYQPGREDGDLPGELQRQSEGDRRSGDGADDRRPRPVEERLNRGVRADAVEVRSPREHEGEGRGKCDEDGQQATADAR